MAEATSNKKGGYHHIKKESFLRPGYAERAHEARKKTQQVARSRINTQHGSGGKIDCCIVS